MSIPEPTLLEPFLSQEYVADDTHREKVIYAVASEGFTCPPINYSTIFGAGHSLPSSFPTFFSCES